MSNRIQRQEVKYVAKIALMTKGLFLLQLLPIGIINAVTQWNLSLTVPKTPSVSVLVSEGKAIQIDCSVELVTHVFLIFILCFLLFSI